ncbi:MAG: hypothetical protein IKT16_08255, partial [Desulfovibrio sp.]|nr:hypothetical protein [Desulfovibrio sp.]
SLFNEPGAPPKRRKRQNAFLSPECQQLFEDFSKSAGEALGFFPATKEACIPSPSPCQQVFSDFFRPPSGEPERTEKPAGWEAPPAMASRPCAWREGGFYAWCA